MMTDSIADMLTRIRNACQSKHRRVDMPVSRMKTEIARILKENNFIQDYATIETEHFIVKFDRGQDELLARYAARYLEDEALPELTRELEFAPKSKRAGASASPVQKGERSHVLWLRRNPQKRKSLRSAKRLEAIVHADRNRLDALLDVEPWPITA